MPRRSAAGWVVGAKLNPLWQTQLSTEGTRDGFGRGLLRAAEEDDRITVLCADLSESTRTHLFRDRFPERFVEIGVSEQSLASIAAGMALEGRIPFIASYAAFSPGRNWEQIRTTVALQKVPVKIIGAHAGVSVGPDGATHQMTEDIALMRVLPQMHVVVPCDAIEAEKATIHLAQDDTHPGYLRLTREASPTITTSKTPFEFGKILPLRKGKDIAFFASGPILIEAMRAAENLAKEDIEVTVINVHTIKPFDVQGCVEVLEQTGAVVVIEEAQQVGGLGGLICETASAHLPVPIECIGMPDTFGESGQPKELWEVFGLTAPFIELAARRVLDRKNGKKVSIIPKHRQEQQKHARELREAAFTHRLSAHHRQR